MESKLAHVAGAQPAIHDGFGGELGFVEMASHHGFTADGRLRRCLRYQELRICTSGAGERLADVYPRGTALDR